MKKILTSVAVLGFVGALAVGGTGAFFSDSETSSNNVLTAGAIDLQIDNESYYNGVLNTETTWETATDLDDGHLFFDFDDLKPGDWGEDTISVHVDSNDSYACAYVTKTADDENLPLVGPEEEEGDDPNSDEGELDEQLYFLWWGDDGDNVLEDDETVINEGYFGGVQVGQEITVALADSEQNIWGEDTLPGGDIRYIGKAWCYGDVTIDKVPAGDNNSPTIDPGFECSGALVDNMSQTDSTMLDVRFTAVQSRHNEEFVCEGKPVNPGDPETIDAEGPFDGWNGDGELIWQAEARFGGNNTWEYGVGNDTHTAAQSNNQAGPDYDWQNGVAVPFTVAYDGSEATFTVDGNSVNYTVGPITSNADMNIIAGKVSSGAGDNVELTDLKLDGVAINPDSLVDTDNTNAKYLVISSEDLSGGFTVTGMAEFNWTSATTNDSRPDFQVQIRD